MTDFQSNLGILLKHYKTKAKVGRVLLISPSTIDRWYNHEGMPSNLAMNAIELAVKGIK